jgi:hypothetical protein
LFSAAAALQRRPEGVPAVHRRQPMAHGQRVGVDVPLVDPGALDLRELLPVLRLYTVLVHPGHGVAASAVGAHRLVVQRGEARAVLLHEGTAHLSHSSADGVFAEVAMVGAPPRGEEVPLQRPGPIPLHLHRAPRPGLTPDGRRRNAQPPPLHQGLAHARQHDLVDARVAFEGLEEDRAVAAVKVKVLYYNIIYV